MAKKIETEIMEEVLPAAPLRRSPLVAGAVIVLLVALGIFLGVKFVGLGSDDSRYSAVYLTTGDVYFGELAWFPKPHLKDALYLERGGEQIALRSFKDVFWGPGKEIYLNPKEIVFSAPIRSDSPLVRVLDDPSLLNAPAPAATSTSQ